MEGAEHGALGGERLALFPERGGLGDAEVEDLGMVVRGDHHVLGLEIAMDEPGRVGRREPLGHLARQPHGEGGRGEPSLQQLAECPSLDVLEDEDVARGVLHHIVDPHHGGVAQPRRRRGLAAEPLAFFGGRLLAPDALEGHPPAQALIPGEEHLPHAALTDPARQAVGPDAGRLRRRVRRASGLRHRDSRSGSLYPGPESFHGRGSTTLGALAAEPEASDWPTVFLGGSGGGKRCGPAKGEYSPLPILRI
jgi:hypothetical protein